ncbi:contractile injection system protein, VgrG/Pvc8 family, partial [Staphylococcus aureus]
MLAQTRTEAVVARGKSRHRHLAPGYTFTLTDHAEPSFNRGFVVHTTRCRGHNPFYQGAGEEGRARPVYENTFSALP